jgi:hypothetical protein
MISSQAFAFDSIEKTLTQQLNERKAKNGQKMPPKVKSVFKKATKDLKNLGL